MKFVLGLHFLQIAKISVIYSHYLLSILRHIIPYTMVYTYCCQKINSLKLLEMQKEGLYWDLEWC